MAFYILLFTLPVTVITLATFAWWIQLPDQGPKKSGTESASKNTPTKA